MTNILIKLKNWWKCKDLPTCSNCGHYHPGDDHWWEDGCGCDYPNCQCTWTW